MRSLGLITVLILSLVLALPGQESHIIRAEKLFAGRDNIENLKQAVSLLAAALPRESSDYEVLWRLAKYRYYLSDQETNEANRVKLLESAIDAAKKAVALKNERPEGHFWLAASTGEYAGLKGSFRTLWLIKTIRREFEAVLKIDPAYENGDAYLALGELDIRLPKLFGGDDQRGIQRLETGLKVGPKNADLKLTLAENYAKQGRVVEARTLAESVLSVDDPSRTASEQEEFRNKARRLLNKLK